MKEKWNIRLLMRETADGMERLLKKRNGDRRIKKSDKTARREKNKESAVDLFQQIKGLPPQVKGFLKFGLIWAVLLTLLLNPMGSGLITSIKNQELFAFHLSDLISYADQGKNQDQTNYYLSTGTYEKEKDGPLFGVAKGKNLILIQIESFQNIMLNREYHGQEITPNLNKLLKEQGTLYFDHYYQELGSGNTSDSEFATNNSILGSIESFTYNLYDKNYFRGLPWILKDNGYNTAVFHGFDKNFWNRAGMYPAEGFDTFYNSDYFKDDNLIGLDGKNVRGISDTAFLQQSAAAIEKLPQPFYGFLITLSSHHPFHLPSKLQGIKLKPQDQGTLFGDYINAVHYADQSLGKFFDQLKKDGIYDNSVIGMYGDHFGLPPTDPQVKRQVEGLIGRDYRMDVAMNIPLIIHVPGLEENKTYSITGGEVDFMPTICSLLGIDQLDTLYLGQNLLTAKKGFVFEQTHLLKGSFFTDDIVFHMSRDGVFANSKAYERDSNKEVDFSSYEDLYLKAKQLVELSNFYLKNDVLRKALVEGMSMDEILSGAEQSTGRPKVITYAGAPQWNSDNLIQALSDSYQAGYTDLIVPVTLNQGDPSQIYYMDLVQWLKKHKKATVFAQIDESDQTVLVDTLRAIREADGKLTERMVPILHSMDNYTKTQYEGYSNILFMPSADEYNRKDLADFITLNKPWALAVPADQADTVFRDLLQSDAFVYAYPVENVTEKSRLASLGVDGFISKKVTPLLLR